MHGLGVNPADGTLYVASHFGVFRIRQDGSAHRVGNRYQDTMGFTVVGPDRFLGSGHPDPSEDLPPYLGLIESTDAAESWTAVSLQGQADFHALEATEDLVVGYDAASGRLLVSADGRSWRQVARANVLDLALDPTNHGRVLATSPQGAVVEYPLDGGEPRTLSMPPLAFLDWPTQDLLVGLGGDGMVYRSDDGGDSWLQVEGPPGDPQAVSVEDSAWHVATSTGIFRSGDAGRSWHNMAKPAD